MLRLLTFIFTSLFAIIFTMSWSLLITLAGVIKLIVPIPAVSRRATAFANLMMYGWACCLAFVLKYINGVEWDIEGLDNLSKENWYLLICNHQSWADIVVLSGLFRNHIPMNKYFLKQELLWVPFVGIACWALDMPFMKRYSRAYLLKHPHLRGKDIETTKRSCEKFRLQPTTVVNFIEGSRFTEEKKIKSNSPYRHLLPPKAAGIAFTLNALGSQFDKLLNVTLLYPDNHKSPFMDILCGRMKRVVVRVEVLPISDDIRGDYFNNKSYKRQFQLWLNQLWEQKDQLLDALKTRTSLRK
jgi:1-acyl-sn-glycerol-3-phosphate acyltransferase